MSIRTLTVHVLSEYISNYNAARDRINSIAGETQRDGSWNVRFDDAFDIYCRCAWALADAVSGADQSMRRLKLSEESVSTSLELRRELAKDCK